MISRCARAEKICPKIAASGYERHSYETKAYNCIAYAAGDLWEWWDHFSYWPDGATRGAELRHLIEAFECEGFTSCGETFLAHPNFEFVALYVDAEGEWTHAARLRSDGWWESKLGNLEDIIHKTPECVESQGYGSVAWYMKRALVASARARVAARVRAKQNGKL
jgi:hypothetical protein